MAGNEKIKRRFSGKFCPAFIKESHLLKFQQKKGLRTFAKPEGMTYSLFRSNVFFWR
jgi:hypothetical protein